MIKTILEEGINPQSTQTLVARVDILAFGQERTASLMGDS
jgi:hypothetical protein